MFSFLHLPIVFRHQNPQKLCNNPNAKGKVQLGWLTKIRQYSISILTNIPKCANIYTKHIKTQKPLYQENHRNKYNRTE